MSIKLVNCFFAAIICHLTFLVDWTFYAFIFRWVSKDGIGAVGRLFIGLGIHEANLRKYMIVCKHFYLTWRLLVFPGGRFGNLFDDDPKQWRMYADFIGSAGRSELAFLFLYGNMQMKYSSKETLTAMVSHAAFLILQPSYILDIFFHWHLLEILQR